MSRHCFLCCLLGLAPLLLVGQRRSFESLYKREDVNRDIVVRNAGPINSPRLEFSPALYENGLVFVSQYRQGPVDERTGQTFTGIYYAELDASGMPLKLQPFSGEIDSEFYDGPVSFNRQFDRIFFSRSSQRKNRWGRFSQKIFMAQRGYFDWENVRELPFNNDDFSCMHPALAPDGKRLFFASDMPGGYGGMDLYFVEKQGEGWSAPINMGPEINTTGNEVFPFFHESNMLFFASDGHRGLGGLDIFMIDLGARKWGRVINLGEPFNSPGDDLGLVLQPDGIRGYFTSNREGGAGLDDIYMFEASGGIRGMELPETFALLLTVYDGQASKRLAGSDIRIFERSADGLVKNEDFYNMELLPSEESDGELVMKMVRKKEVDLGDPRAVTNRNGEGVLQIEAAKDYLIMVSKPGFISKELNYRYDQDSGPLRPVEIALDPSNCLNLNGLVRMEGYTIPLPNTTVRIINRCNGSQEFAQTNAEGVFVHCLEIGCDYAIIAEKPGYQPNEATISTIKIRGSRSADVEIRLTPSGNTVVKEPIREGTIIVLQNIYYDFNKSAIRTGEARELELLARLMKRYPSMEIELGAHTDCRGTDDYNLQLSLRRAESAREFLVQRGISADRVKAIGYGESKLRNQCNCSEGMDCSEQEHQYNRRTEVKIIHIEEPVEIGYGRDGLRILDERH